MNTEVLGCVRVKGATPKVVSAGSLAVLDGVVHLSCCPTDNLMTLEQPAISSMPGRILLACHDLGLLLLSLSLTLCCTHTHTHSHTHTHAY